VRKILCVTVGGSDRKAAVTARLVSLRRELCVCVWLDGVTASEDCAHPRGILCSHSCVKDRVRQCPNALVL
jgi:hypothetical protein